MASHLDQDPQDHESGVQFANRKVDHIRLSLSQDSQAVGAAGLDKIQLIHEALPDVNFAEVDISCEALDAQFATPFFVSSMTAGHGDAAELNARMARAAEARGWRMGVGSQRRELKDPSIAEEWKSIRQSAPKVTLYGNLGLAQLIHTPVEDVQRLVDSLEASAMIIHLNALQECLQPEGTPQFKGGLEAIERLCDELNVPVIVKETGCGMSKSTLKRLRGLGVGAVDLSGLGGTHWGRIEGARNPTSSVRSEAAETLANWGISTLDSLLAAMDTKIDFEVWASGGVRSGLDAAKLLALGAQSVGWAMPVLAAALKGEAELLHQMERWEFELKTILFCTGSRDVDELQNKKVWKWRDN